MPGSGLQNEIPLPTDLLTNDNTLTFQLQGSCAACRHTSAPWITINPNSVLSLSGTRLALANDLALLPVPFFDSAGQHSWSLPVVFSGRPDMDALEAGSVVASWFGIFSDFRGVRFPVTVGDLPPAYALLFPFRHCPLAARLWVFLLPGALVATRSKPRD